MITKDDVVSIVVGSDEVLLDPSRLEFNETNLSQYMMREAGWYNYFGSRLADLEAILDMTDLEYDRRYNERFVLNKEAGGSDNFVKAKTEAEPELVDLKKRLTAIKRSVTKLKLHLKAWDKNHENAQSVGHTLRREMDKLNFEVRSSQGAAALSSNWMNDVQTLNSIEDFIKPAE